MESNHLSTNLQVSLYAIEKIEVGTWWNYKRVNSPFTRIFYSENAKKTWLKHNGKQWDIGPGRLLIAPPFTEVDYFCGENCQLYGMIITAELFPGIQLFSMEGIQHKVNTDKLLLPLIDRLLEINPGIEVPTANPFNKAYNDDIRKQVQQRHTSLSKTIESDAILRMILSRFAECDTEELRFPTQNSASNARLLKILDYIGKHLDQPLTLNKLAELVGLNPTYLSNDFAKKLNIRPTSYIKQKRIERAQRLLISTNLPLKQISYEIGIPNTDYFFQIFKKALGCTPSEYRRNYSA